MNRVRFVTALLFTLLVSAPAAAQLRPLEPVVWEAMENGSLMRANVQAQRTTKPKLLAVRCSACYCATHKSCLPSSVNRSLAVSITR